MLGAGGLRSDRETAIFPDGLVDSCPGDGEAEVEEPRRQAVTCHCACWHQLEAAAHSPQDILEEEHRESENEQEALVARVALQQEQDANATQRYAQACAVLGSLASGVERNKVMVEGRAQDRQVGS